jgi:DNA-binding CsgD family transcriptional regulator
MLVDEDGTHAPAPSVESFQLDAAVADIYADLRVNPLLRRLLGHSQGLLGTAAGSVSLIDRARGRYDKAAEIGIACRLGQSFPLDEGATGHAFNRRMPVVIDDYSRLGGGHLPGSHPAGHGAVAAVPLWWRDEIIGVNVAFAGRRRTFSSAEIDAFELLTQSVASAVVKAGRSVPSLAGLLREHGRVEADDTGVQTLVTEVGRARPVSDGVATAAADLVSLVRRSTAARANAARLHVAVLHRPDGLRLLVQDESAEPVAGSTDPLGLGTKTWRDLLAVSGGGPGGAVDVEHVPGWGTFVRADFPDPDPDPHPESGPDRAADAASPLTGREREVLRLLADGLSDREVAGRLMISPKTVDKHVGAALRKTGAPSRTAAVVRAIDRGWL